MKWFPRRERWLLIWAAITFDRACRVAWLLIAAAFVWGFLGLPTTFTVLVGGARDEWNGVNIADLLRPSEPVRIEVSKP
jgi:hypothetical protein